MENQMSPEKYTAEMNAVAASYVEMANRHRLNWRNLALVPAFGNFVFAAFSMACDDAVIAAVTICSLISTSWMIRSAFREGQKEWSECMQKRQDILDERDRDLREYYRNFRDQ